MTTPLKLFKEIDISNLVDKTIILDIDGTILIDGKEDVQQSEKSKIAALAAKNEILLCSNKRLPVRNKNVSSSLGLKIINTSFKKPNKKVLENIEDRYLQKSLVVIGDKFTTDGIFARNIGAEFIKVKRLKEDAPNFLTLIEYLIDDVVYKIVILLRRLV